MDHSTFLKQLPAEQKAHLSARSDLAGLKHLGLYVLALSVTSLGIVVQVPLWPVLLIPQGILIVFLFTLSHECTHQTPFRTKALNEVVGHAIAPIMLLPFLWFRYFHLAHHKFTNDPERDPEIAAHPRPQDWRSYLIYLSGWGYWSGMVRVLNDTAHGRIDAPYLPTRKHRALRIEARIVLCVQAALLLTLIWSPLVLWLWIVPALIGQPFLRAYLLAEHGLCPPVADMFENTRTTYTGAVIRFLAWNMPYHAEHHSAPNVPFHKLPELNRLVASELQSTSQGYSAFSKDYAASLK